MTPADGGTEAQTVAFDPFDPEFKRDPYPTYHSLRETDPVHETPLGNYVLTRYADVVSILRDPSMSSDFRNSTTYAQFREMSPTLFEDRQPSLLFLDPPDHTRLRTLVNKAFTARRIEQLRDRVDEVVDELLGRARTGGEMDVVEDLAYPLPVTVISEMLGVPAEDHRLFRSWSQDLVATLDPIVPPDRVERAMRSSDAFREYFRALIAQRRSAPSDDLLSALIEAEDQGKQLTEEELLITLVLLLVAGHETTVNLISNGVFALLTNRDQWERLVADPSLIRTAIEELLRFDSPVQFIGRVAMHDLELDGVSIDKGKELIGLLGAANRDPGQFADPDRLDITRSDNRHLAFSGGAHFCLGASLARLEGQIAIGALAREFPAMELIDTAPPHRETMTLRGLASLKVAI
ncbi:MAG TPA: cytochrome P450 [Actinomycetota bacterium]|nr:cytochrome P450 [Actinomycetota bacterium]